MDGDKGWTGDARLNRGRLMRMRLRLTGLKEVSPLNNESHRTNPESTPRRRSGSP